MIGYAILKLTSEFEHEHLLQSSRFDKIIIGFFGFSVIMLATSCYLDTNRLPNNVFSYTDQVFYDFVEVYLGELYARLLYYLHMRSVPCFLLTENPCGIFALDIDDELLEELSQEMCIKLKNKQLIVKPDIENGFVFLKSLLLKKIQDETKGQTTIYRNGRHNI